MRFGVLSPGGLHTPSTTEGVLVSVTLIPSSTRHRAVGTSCPTGDCSPCNVLPTPLVCPCPSLVLGALKRVGEAVRKAYPFTSCTCVLCVQLPFGHRAERSLLVAVTARACTVTVGIATLLLPLQFTHHSTYHVPRQRTHIYGHIDDNFVANVIK